MVGRGTEEGKQRKQGKVAEEIMSECWTNNFWMIAKPWQKAKEVRESPHDWSSLKYLLNSPTELASSRAALRNSSALEPRQPREILC